MARGDHSRRWPRSPGLSLSPKSAADGVRVIDFQAAMGVAVATVEFWPFAASRADHDRALTAAKRSVLEAMGESSAGTKVAWQYAGAVYRHLDGSAEVTGPRAAMLKAAGLISGF